MEGPRVPFSRRHKEMISFDAFRVFTSDYFGFLNTCIDSIEKKNTFLIVNDDVAGIKEHGEYLYDVALLDPGKKVQYEVLQTINSHDSEEAVLSIVKIAGLDTLKYFSFYADQVGFFSFVCTDSSPQNVLDCWSKIGIPFSDRIGGIDLKNFADCFSCFIAADYDHDGLNEQSFICKFDTMDKMKSCIENLRASGYVESGGRQKSSHGFEFSPELGAFYWCKLNEELQILKKSLP